jgi:hypothetical protein
VPSTFDSWRQFITLMIQQINSLIAYESSCNLLVGINDSFLLGESYWCHVCMSLTAYSISSPLSIDQRWLRSLIFSLCISWSNIYWTLLTTTLVALITLLPGFLASLNFLDIVILNGLSFLSSMIKISYCWFFLNSLSKSKLIIE